MAADWTRRDFLNTGICGTALVASIEPASSRPPGVLDEKHRKTLTAICEQIIPAGDGMPSAVDAGGVSYLEKLIAQEPGPSKAIRYCIESLMAKGERPDRVKALQEIEAESPVEFALLRDSVYEAYYTQPHIWKLIGYDLNPTDHAGPSMKPFDESIIATVSKKPKGYREA